MTQKQRRRSWSPQEKQRLAEEARERRERGEQWHEIARALGARPEQLREWMRHHLKAGLQRVELVKAPAALGAIAVVSPDGFRFEAADIDAAVELWRRLR